jgi:hypothetical protein
LARDIKIPRYSQDFLAVLESKNIRHQSDQYGGSEKAGQNQEIPVNLLMN